MSRAAHRSTDVPPRDPPPVEGSGLDLLLQWVMSRDDREIRAVKFDGVVRFEIIQHDPGHTFENIVAISETELRELPIALRHRVARGVAEMLLFKQGSNEPDRW